MKPDAPYLTDDEFAGYLHQAVTYAHAKMKEDPQPGFAPLAMLVHFGTTDNANKAHAQTLVLFQDFDLDQRQETLFALGHKMGRESRLVVGIIFLSEVWMAASTVDEYAKKDFVMPRDNPARVEKVAAFGMTIDGRGAMALIDTTRSRHNMLIPHAIQHHPVHEMQKIEAPLLRHFFAGYQRGLIELLDVRMN